MAANREGAGAPPADGEPGRCEPVTPSNPFNFARHVMDLNRARGDKTAYIDDQGELSYGALESSIRRFGDGLLQLGLRAEQRVLLLMQDCNDWPIAFLGAIHAGLIPIPINTLLTADDYAYVLDHSDASAAVVSRSLLPVLAAALVNTSKQLCRVVIVGGAPLDAPLVSPVRAAAAPRMASPSPPPFAIHTTEFAEVLARGRTAYAGAPTHPDATAFWLYSSGSTGRPKGVVHTHANLFWTAELYAKRVLGITAEDTVFSAAKLFFAYGLGNGLTFPLSVGACTLLMADRATPDAVFARLERRRPTLFCGAPTLYAGMLASPVLPPRRSLALRLCTSAGEALPREIGEKFAAHFGCDIIDGLGSTEMLHIFVSNHPGDIRYGTTGKPVGGYQVELRDESGTAVPRGTIGDLWVQGPSAALMYWNDRAKTRDTFHGPWLRTGDKYICREDGYFVYAGRNDDMLRISGQYVSPFEVESTLMQHTAVLEAAVVGVMDDSGIAKCKAFVVLRDDAVACEALAAELRSYVKERLAPFKRPHYIDFIKDLPKTATGKIQRFRLRERPVP